MDQEVRRKRMATVAKWGIAVVGLAVVSPLVYLALKAALGLLALAVAGAVGYAMIELAPVFAMKIANWKVKLIVGEAESNPIETLQNDYVERFKEVEAKDKELEDWEVELRNYDDELVGIKRDYPAEAENYASVSREMHGGLEDARLEQAQTRAALSEYEKAITKAKRLFKMALAAQRVTSFSKSTEDRVMQDIKRQAALDSVRSNVNRSLARLNTAMAKRQSRPALPGAERPALPEAQPTDVIDITPVAESDRVPIPRMRRKEE